jgi:hypothetical protein
VDWGGSMLGAGSARAAILIALAASFVLAQPHAAHAQFHVAEPEVVKGQGQIADHGALYAGAGTEEKLNQSHQLEMYYGLTDRLAFLTLGLLQQPIGSPLEADFYEVGGQYQILKPQGEGLALAFRSRYQLALQDGDANQILYGPIAKLGGRRAAFTVDTFFIRDLDSSDTTALNVNWQAKHGLSDRISIGVEGYSKIANVAHAGTFNEQEHRVGPVVYLKLGPWTAKEFRDISGVGEEKIFGLSFGTLFGMTSPTSDLTFKINLVGVF